MFLCRRQLFKGFRKLAPKPALRYSFCETPKESQSESQPKSSLNLTTFLGLGVVGLLGYGAYQEYTKKSGSVGGDSSANIEVVLPSSVINAIEVHGKNSVAVASALKEEALKLAKEGDHEKSYALLLESQKVYKAIYGENCDEVATLSREIGHNFFNRGKVEEAQEHIQKASDIHMALGDFTHGLDELESLALSYVKEFDKAKELLEKSIALRKEKIGENDPFLAKSYIRYAMLYTSQRLKNEALEMLETAFNLMKKNKVPKESQSAFYQELALVYHNIGALDQALKNTQKAIESLDSKTEGPKIRQLTKQIAAIHALQNQLPKSIDTYKTVLEQYKKEGGSVNPLEVADTYRRIADGYEKMNDFNTAIQNWNKYIDIFRSLGKNEIAVSAKMKSCSLYFKINQQDKGIDCFEDAFILASGTLGDNHKLTNDSFEILQVYKEGRTSKKKCVEILKVENKIY